MQNEFDPIRDDQFEAFLDGTLSEAERELVLKKLKFDHERRAQANLQMRIDESLRKTFPVVCAPVDHPLLAENADSAAEVQGLLQRRPLLLGGAAAALFGISWTWWALDSGKPLPFFKPMPLADIYRSTLANGFHPYYVCRDDERFADIFSSRQGIPLHLLPMPAGTKMLGLSYPGGLSRETTAMLCLVDDAPVMVFVDQAVADSEIAGRLEANDLPVNVFRAERYGLVFYEVSELDEPRALEFLAVGAPPDSKQ